MKRSFMTGEITASDREDQAGQKSTQGTGISNSPGTGTKLRNVDHYFGGRVWFSGHTEVYKVAIKHGLSLTAIIKG